MLDRRQFLLALAVGAYAPPLRAQTAARATHRVEIKGFAGFVLWMCVILAVLAGGAFLVWKYLI